MYMYKPPKYVGWANKINLIEDPTNPKLRFPTCPAYQNMTFPHISYTYLAEDREGFYANI